MKRLALGLGISLLLALVACRREVAVLDKADAATDLMRPAPTPTAACLPTQVLRCTLGPPPVCHCEPTAKGLETK